MPRLRLFLLGLVLAAPLACAPFGWAQMALTPTVAEALQAKLQTPRTLTVDLSGSALTLDARVGAYYRAAQFAPVWVETPEAQARADAFVRILEEAIDDGLYPEAYHASALRALLATTPPGDAAQATDLELLLTHAFFRYADDLLGLRVNPEQLYAVDDWHRDVRTADLPAILTRIRTTGQVRGALDPLHPAHPAYWRLRDELARYRTLAADPRPWPTILPTTTIQPGETSTQLPAIREQLIRLGDYLNPHPSLASEFYEPTLRPAVERFQRRMGLEVDGTIGQATRAALNRNPAGYVAMIEANLERWRWLPTSFSPNHVVVNIPAFELRVVEQEQTVLDMRVIVGKTTWKTPVFNTYLDEVIFHPTWSVPTSIAADETLPAARRNGGAYLRNRNYRVYDRTTGEAVDPTSVDWSNTSAGRYRFVQQPGGSNPLGEVKFDLNNPYGIYLHDTNSRGLFSREGRAFSHGCIRVAKPHELAEYLLTKEPNWTAESVQRAFAARQLRGATLSSHLPVHIVYFTAWADADGLRFFPDVYDYDEPLVRALNATRPPALSSR